MAAQLFLAVTQALHVSGLTCEHDALSAGPLSPTNVMVMMLPVLITVFQDLGPSLGEHGHGSPARYVLGHCVRATAQLQCGVSVTVGIHVNVRCSSE